MKKVFYSKIALLFLSTYLYAASCVNGNPVKGGTDDYLSGTCAFGEFIDIKEVAGYKNGQINLIYDVSAWNSSKAMNNVWGGIIPYNNLDIRNIIKDNREYDDIWLNNKKYIQKGGIGYIQTSNDIISSGLIGKKLAIANDEDILFSLIPYRDRSQPRNEFHCTGDKSKKCMMVDKWDVSNIYYQTAKVTPVVGVIGETGGIATAFGLYPYALEFKNKWDSPTKRAYKLIDAIHDSAISVYVQTSSGRYVSLNKTLIDNNGNTILPYDYTNNHTYDTIRMLDTRNKVADIPYNNAYYFGYIRNEVNSVSHPHEIIIPSLFALENSRTLLNYGVRTFKKCKQNLLYKIQIHSAKINGKYGQYNIYNDGHAHDSFKAQTLYLPTNCTNGDKSDGSPTGCGTYEFAINSESEPAIFFVLQDGSKDADAIDCLSAPNVKINTAWIDNNSTDNFKFGKENTSAGKGVYTILNGDTTYVRLDFSSLNNNDETNELDKVLDPNDTFSEREARYISIDVGNIKSNQEMQEHCKRYGISCDNNTTYFTYSYAQAPNGTLANYDLGAYISDEEIAKGLHGYTYKAMCEYVNRKNKGKDGYTPCNSEQHSNEIFYKYTDATIRFNALTTAESDLARREFKIKFYRDINNLADGGKIIKHIPITVRPKSMNIKDIHSCAIFTNCFPNENIGSQTEQLSSNNTIYHDGVSYVFVIGEYKLKVFDSKGNPYYFNIAQGSKNANAISYPNNTRNIPATGRSHNLTIINPFATTNANVIVKEEHIRKFLDEFKAKNNEFKDYKYTDSCIDNNEYVDKITANTAIEHKIYCQTPLEREISPKITGVTNKFIIKDNIDKDARANVFITSNPEEFKYRIYPQIQSLAANDINVSRYFPKALNIELKLNFNDSVKDENKLNLDFDNETFIGNEYRAFSTSSKVEKNNFSFNVELDSEALNQNYDTALKEASDICKDDCTTSWLIDKTTNKKYAHIEKNKAITEELRYNARLAQANDNAVEIPLALTYTKKQNALRLDSLDFIIDETKNNNSSFTSTKIKENIPVNTLFVSAVAMFKDKKADTGAKKANMNTNDVWLHYIDKGGIFRPFAYLKTDNKSDDWKITKAELDNKKQVDCDDNTPCYRILNSSNEVPGLEDKIKYSSDYQSSVKLLKVGAKVSGLEIELNNDMKKLQYVKDTIHCYGGLFNCDSRWTVEFVK
ncbi:hypothetical protein [Campylobacter canadensis]|uniref:Lipoprotein n=1 Tax=Campylobacter canadensis TaxID=449520 RepID=A0ABS7WSR1_9BACT|nr:hypothetical protein [Campylobacter canadensis]MBZ7987553.1 hypothetical protein [Campylobacter canadensis]MBZ7998691.1 hypothetical protein [Campylobacter canadensis]